MKKLSILALCLSMALGIYSCGNESKSESQAGVYSMEKQVGSDGKTETVNQSSDGGFQIKIYTDQNYFYVAMTKDSSASFGLGTYTLKGSKIEEKNIYNAASLDTAGTFNLDIAKSEKGYSQVIPEIMIQGKKWKLTEEYTSLPTTGTSELDGVWKQSKSLVVSGKDTTDNTYNEYKVYSGGHFMWATRYQADTTKKEYKNVVGHGTFGLKDGALTEQLDKSSLAGAVGKYDIKIAFNGKDEYTQETADTKNNSVGFKTYQRVK
jgi:hypothetical protein